MTAVVGILNKHAIAIAADSAVTISNGNKNKIFNRANKIFTLSKHFPVGIMIYNSASFMGTPWEVIIKIYRQQLKEKSFDTLNEYKNDFIQFLRNKDFFTDQETSKIYLYHELYSLISNIIIHILRSSKLNYKDASKHTEILQLIENEISKEIEQVKQIDVCDDFQDFSLEDFRKYTEDTINEVYEESFKKFNFAPPDSLKQKLEEFFYYFVKIQEGKSSYTGLVFVGFGENEIYPTLISVIISFSIDKRLRFFIGDETQISNDMPSAICPFAQVDVIQTILSGIDPRLEEAYFKHFNLFLSNYNNLLIQASGGQAGPLATIIAGIDQKQLIEELVNTNRQLVDANYNQPLLDAVEGLSKEDLAEMAESLIYLTYLKRRMTNAEESVGGPVDVAILSKGDGFIWIKRKHYFKPELNTNFFNNYYK